MIKWREKGKKNGLSTAICPFVNKVDLPYPKVHIPGLI
jgi:hypothetical protein